MPGPVEPNWGIPQEFAAHSIGATYSRSSGSFNCQDSVQRFVCFGRADDGTKQWYLLAGTETTQYLPNFFVEDNVTIAVLTRGTWDKTRSTMVLNGVTYNLSMQKSQSTRQTIAVAVAV